MRARKLALMVGGQRCSFGYLFGCLIAFAVVFFTVTTVGCGSVKGDCSNGKCICDQGADCDFSCGAPPCHASCAGHNDHCTAVCSNGDCVCGSDSSCDFTCSSPPCHVTCAAHDSCRGECANGQCTCGQDSSCDFTCLTSPCHTSCAAGSHCVVHCPMALAGTLGCDIVACAAGAPLVCADGVTTTCNADCPQ